MIKITITEEAAKSLMELELKDGLGLDDEIFIATGVELYRGELKRMNSRELFDEAMKRFDLRFLAEILTKGAVDDAPMLRRDLEEMLLECKRDGIF